MSNSSASDVTLSSFWKNSKSNSTRGWSSGRIADRNAKGPGFESRQSNVSEGICKYLSRLTLIPATGGMKWPPPCAVFVENRIVSNGMRQLFFDIVTDQLDFPIQRSTSLYLLPVLHGRFGRNVHVTRFATTNVVRLWCKDMNFTDVIFWIFWKW